MSLDLLDTLEACLERALAAWSVASAPAQSRIIASSLAWTRMAEANGDTARFWLAALDYGARETAGAAAAIGFHAGHDGFLEAIERARASLDRMPPRVAGLLSDTFDLARETVSPGVVAPNLLTAMRVATQETYAAALAAAPTVDLPSF